MKYIIKIAVFIPLAALMFIADITPNLAPPYLQLFPEAVAWTDQGAFLVSRRRMRRRGVIVGASVEKRRDAQASSQQQQQESTIAQEQTATAKQQAATAQQQAATAKQQAATAEAILLPEGTVVTTLPPTCTPMQVSGVEYQHCGVNYYRTAFQGNNLVYVTTHPE